MQYRPPRFKSDTETVIETERGAFHVRVTNVSAKGMCLAGVRDLALGDRVTCRVLAEDVPATVAWSIEDQFGVWFDQSIGVDALRVMRCET